MDQHEQDWLDLGRQLKQYQPGGNSAKDFADFQQFQQSQNEGDPSAGSRSSLLLGLLLVIAVGLGFLLWPSEVAEDTARPQVQIALEKAVPTTPATTPITLAKVDPSFTRIAAGPSSASSQAVAARSVRPSASPGAALPKVPRPANATTPQAFGRGDTDVTMNASLLVTPPTANPPAIASTTSATAEERKAGEGPSDLLKTGTTGTGTGIATAASAAPVASRLALLPVAPLTPITAVAAVEPLTPSNLVAQLPPPAPAFSASARPLRLSLGAGLSSHWRGVGFMEDIDQGVYVNIGLRKDFSSRFGAELQLGYRDQSLDLPALGDTEARYWSHHTAMSAWTDTQGNTHRYEYEGTVEGYRAVELNLLLHYRLLPRLGLSAGGRVALPTLQVDRFVGGSEVQNPYKKFVEEQPLVRHLDYGMRFGAEYLLTKQLTIETNIHVGLVDLIEDAGEGIERFNHSNTLSIGLRYSLGGR